MKKEVKLNSNFNKIVISLASPEQILEPVSYTHLTLPTSDLV